MTTIPWAPKNKNIITAINHQNQAALNTDKGRIF